MKRSIVAAFVVLFSTALHAENRYLVATKHPFGNGTLKEVRQALAAGDITPFEAFKGFAATLSEAEVATLRASNEVRWIEPVIERNAVAQARNQSGQTTPYGVELVHAPEAWTGRRADTVNVAVLDTGIDYNHPELQAIYAGGYNLFNKSGTPFDDAGHGTHVAGTIAATDDKNGVVGVAPNVRLWGVKVLNQAGGGNTETVVGGIDWVVKKKAEVGGNWVINLSLGSPKPSAAEREAIARAIDAGIIVVAASGNESSATVKAPVIYPAAYPGVLAVGAIDDTETIAGFSNQGAELDFVAPGVAVLSTIPAGLNFVSSITAGVTQYFADALDRSAAGKVAGEFVYCGLGHPTHFPPTVKGRIAVIKRGELTFAVKARNAFEAGAAGVVIFNNSATTPISWTLLSEADPWSFTYKWPAPVVAMTKTDGEALLNQSGEITLVIDPDDYAFFNGTSMASPHVAGAAALLWCLAPNATPAQVVEALTATARDRGPRGFDPVYGAGVIDVFAAAKQLAPSAFKSGGPTTGRAIGRRGRG